MYLEISNCPEKKKGKKTTTKNPQHLWLTLQILICECHMNNVLCMDNLKYDSSIVICCHTNAKIYCLNWCCFHNEAELVPSPVLQHLASDLSVSWRAPELEISRDPQKCSFPGGARWGPAELCCPTEAPSPRHRKAHLSCRVWHKVRSVLRPEGVRKQSAPSRKWVIVTPKSRSV